MAPDQYAKARSLIQERIEELHGLAKSVDAFERAGISPQAIIDALEQPTRRVARDRRSARRPGAAFQNPANAEQTWPQAIDAVLSSAQRALSVSDIVRDLENRGRRFGESRK